MLEPYSQPSQISKMKRYAKIVKQLKVVNYFTKLFILDVWQGSEYLWMAHRALQIEQTCVIVKTKCFYSFTNNSKLNLKQLKKFRTLFLKNSLTTILDTKLKRFQGGFFELRMVEIFTGAFLLKIIILTWSFLYSASFKWYKVFSLTKRQATT